jgi:hypothetical protein
LHRPIAGRVAHELKDEDFEFAEGGQLANKVDNSLIQFKRD